MSEKNLIKTNLPTDLLHFIAINRVAEFSLNPILRRMILILIERALLLASEVTTFALFF